MWDRGQPEPWTDLIGFFLFVNVAQSVMFTSLALWYVTFFGNLVIIALINFFFFPPEGLVSRGYAVLQWTSEQGDVDSGMAFFVACGVRNGCRAGRARPQVECVCVTHEPAWVILDRLHSVWHLLLIKQLLVKFILGKRWKKCLIVFLLMKEFHYFRFILMWTWTIWANDTRAHSDFLAVFLPKISCQIY